MVTGNDPWGVEALVVMVSTEFPEPVVEVGLNVAVAPKGKPLGAPCHASCETIQGGEVDGIGCVRTGSNCFKRWSGGEGKIGFGVGRGDFNSIDERVVDEGSELDYELPESNSAAL